MKELSIEEKANRYDEAIEMAKSWYIDSQIDFKKSLETLFPELKESEDEKIRKRIIQALHGDVLDMDETAKAITWLEKQSEHKPQGKSAMEAIKEEKVDNAIKVEPKDYNSIDPHFGKPIDFKDEHFYVSKVDGQIHDMTYNSADKVEPKFKIDDIIRFKGNGTLKGEAETHKIVGYDNELYVFADGTTDLFCEQDLYELVEQKPAWSEEDETRLTNTIIMLKEGASLHFNKKDITKAVDWLKSLRTLTTWKPSDEQMEALESATENCAYSEYQDCLRELIEQLKKLKG